MPPQLIEPIPTVSHCALRVTSFGWRGGDGRRALTVICKATYELRPEVSPLAQEQDDIFAEDIHWGGDERHSLRAPSDLVPFKRRVDVLVTGHVYAPQGPPVRSLVARLAIGAMDKSVAVYGDRHFLPTGELSEPAELKKVPLCWERAAGGPSNPVGVVSNVLRSGGDWRWAPNIQPPEIHVTSARNAIPSAGMGPLAPTWPERSQKLGRLAASWDHRNWRAHPLPSEIDAAYFNSAPLDQQVDQIAPDERIVLENLHPKHARLVTWLDGIVPEAVLRRPAQGEQPLNLRCDTLWIDTDRGVCCITWRGSLGLDAAEGGEIHITAERRRGTASAADAQEGRVALGPRSGEPVVPGGDPVAAIETVTLDLGFLVPHLASPVPFVPAPPGAAPIEASPVERREPRNLSADPTATLTGPVIVKGNALPPGWTGSPGATAAQPVAAPPPPAAPELIGTPSLPLSSEPFGVPPPAMVGSLAPMSGSEPPPEGDPLTKRPRPPAMLGTLTGATEPAEPTAPAVEPESFSIEKWAEISAEIDKASRPRAEVLQDHNLTDLDFGAVERHWKAVLDREAVNGGFALRFRHDAAYVGALERLRERPLSASEYARILAASERRQVPAALRDMEMPAAAHMPIVRLWTGKLARDPKLSFEMIQAIAALREGSENSTPATS